jgi:hypothetical protein
MFGLVTTDSPDYTAMIKKRCNEKVMTCKILSQPMPSSPLIRDENL